MAVLFGTSSALFFRCVEDFPWMVQEIMEWGIAPCDAMFLGQSLELLQVFLGDPVACLLVGGITIVDSAAQGPWLARRAKVAFLKRTEVGRHRLVVRGGAGQKNFGLQIAQEQDMAILLETATSATRDADGAGGGDGLIHLLIKLQYLATRFFRHGIFHAKA
jgi:hypothetical protein